MSSLLSVASTLMAMKSSFTLRVIDCFWFRYVFFTYCCVMVEPPWVPSPLAVLTAARARPWMLTAPSL